MNKFITTKNLLLLSSIFCIFWAEWIYIVKDEPLKAIFIGLWSPTILGLLNYFNPKN